MCAKYSICARCGPSHVKGAAGRSSSSVGATLIENQLHWCVDLTFDQDANQTRTKHAAENPAVVRHLALNLVRRYQGDNFSIPRRRRLCDYELDYRERLLGFQRVA